MHRAIVAAFLLAGLAGCVYTPEDFEGRQVTEGCGTTSAGIPDLCGSDGPWFNSDGEDLEDLRGQVVLLDFWTYSCINCIRTLPHLTQLYDTYAPYGFVIIGVHTPEFDFEKDPANVEYAIDKHQIHYPVVMDNDRTIARNFDFRYWPTHHLLGPDGSLVDTHIGEGAYEETEQLVRGLLEAQGHDLPPPFEPLSSEGDFHQGGTPELYAGTWRQAWTIGNEQGYRPGEDVAYRADGTDEPDRLYLDGVWHNGDEALRSVGAGSIYLEFTAGAVNFVIGPSEPGCYPVHLDGAPIPEEHRPADVVATEEGTCVQVTAEDSYDLYEGPFGTHELRIDVPDGLELYTFAFSPRDM